MKKYLSTIILLAVCVLSSAQSMTVRGTVTSAEDGQPLSGVAVILEGTSKGTLTDMDGKWSLSGDLGGGAASYSPVSGIRIRGLRSAGAR